MARIRSIKPEFWTSEQVMECSTNARLLFIGLWNFCDDAGRHPFSPKQVKAEVFPGDDLSIEQIGELLKELSENDLITRYAVDGKEYLQVTGWHHQRIDKPQKPKYPDPVDDSSWNDPGTLPPDTIGKDTKGKERKKVGACAPDEVIFSGTYVRKITAKTVKAWLETFATLDSMELRAELALCDEYYSGQDKPPDNWFFTTMAWVKREHDRRMKVRRDADEAEKRIYAGVQ